MKSSDLKIVAIILSIALFFTIVTSNAVSVASVVMLAKGGAGAQTPAAGTTAPAGTPAGGNSQTPATPAGDSSQAPGTADTTAPAAGTSDTTAPAAGGTTAPAAGGTTAPAGGQTQAPSSGEWTKEKSFNFYKDAVLKIKDGAAAGHTRKEWQEIKDFNLGGSDALLGVIQGFVTSEDKAEPRTSAKGSDDAKNRMCPCGASIDKVAKAECKEVNGNYVITIVMNNETNPEKGSNGVASMSTGILYLEDVKKTIAEDSTVSKLVKSLNDDSKIDYQAYTITATMTKDGKFVSINHTVTGVITAGAKLIIGSVNGGGTLVFNSAWTDFKY